MEEIRSVEDIYELKIKLNAKNAMDAIDCMFEEFTYRVGPICFIRIIEKNSGAFVAFIRFWRHIHNNICLDKYANHPRLRFIEKADLHNLEIHHQYPHTKVNIMRSFNNKLQLVGNNFLFHPHAKFYIAEQLKVGEETIKSTKQFCHAPIHESVMIQTTYKASNIKTTASETLKSKSLENNQAKSSQQPKIEHNSISNTTRNLNNESIELKINIPASLVKSSIASNKITNLANRKPSMSRSSSSSSLSSDDDTLIVVNEYEIEIELKKAIKKN